MNTFLAASIAIAASATVAESNLAGLLSAGQFYHEGTAYTSDR